jgi:hypothetical protein
MMKEESKEENHSALNDGIRGLSPLMLERLVHVFIVAERRCSL